MSKQDTNKNELIKWGAEAIIVEKKWFELDAVSKIRIRKEYRIPQIDNRLRLNRTLAEARLLIAAKENGVRTPFIYEIDKHNFTLVMENIQGTQIKILLNSEEIGKEEKLSLIEQIGENVGKLHMNNIIHGDLTTSNILLQKKQIVFIDFGLGKFSQAIEDKAVDILLMKKCFYSTHVSNCEDYFYQLQRGYQKSMKESKKIFRRAIKVEARGRHLKENDLFKEYLLDE